MSIKQTLTTAEIRSMADYFIEAYEDGWRPEIYTDGLDELVEKAKQARKAEGKNWY